jgi:hypothetical protein
VKYEFGIIEKSTLASIKMPRGRIMVPAILEKLDILVMSSLFCIVLE